MTTIEELKRKMHDSAQKYRRQRESEKEAAEALASMDDLLDAIQPAMKANAARRLQMDAHGEENLQKYCSTFFAVQVLAMCKEL